MAISIRAEFVWLVTAAALVLYWAVRSACLKHNCFKNLQAKELVKTAAVLYAAVVIGATLFPIIIPPAPEPYQMDFLNLDIRDMFHYGSLRSAILNTGGNILLFVPLIPLVALNRPQKEMKLRHAIVISAGASAAIEGLQYLENVFALSDLPIRIADISDLVLNCLGGVIGYIGYLCLFRMKERKN